MKKIIFPAFALLSIISCKNDQPDKDISVIPVTGKMTDTTNAALMTAAQDNVNAGLPQTTGPATASTPQQITGPTTSAAISGKNITTKSTAGINPPHGQPGHICGPTAGEGQKSPAPVTLPTTVSKQNAVVSPAGSNVTNPSASVNPPHGQPGHKCDVGASPNLNTAAPKAMPQTAPSLQGLPVMPQNNPIKSATIPSGSSGKVNPPHGQPGHVCN